MLALAAHAADEQALGRRASAASKPSWDFSATAYPTVVRNADNYTSGILVANRGALHLETRINYESVGARSAFVGWTFSGGDTITWELTPMIGGAWGSINAYVPAFEASVAWKKLDLYIEAEYVRDTHDKGSSYLYSWNELGYRPAQWLRFGAAVQRSRIYGGDRDHQRGPFVQLTRGRVTVGGYWFNPGSSEQVFVGMLSAAF